MKTRVLSMISFVFAVYAGSMVAAKSETEWVAITDPGEMNELVSGKAINGKFWMHYYRSDGNMAYYYPASDAMTVRKWKIEDDGRLCSAVYSKPDRVIDCFTFQRASGAATKYRMKDSAGLFAFEFFDEPPQKLSNALNDTAGVVK